MSEAERDRAVGVVSAPELPEVPRASCRWCGSSKHASEVCYVLELVADATIEPAKGVH